MADPRFYSVAMPSFQKAMRNILTITQASPALITTTYDGINPAAHNYETGLIVILNFYYGWGMEQANQFQGPITVINATQFTIPLDTTTFNPYLIPAFDYTLNQTVTPGVSSNPGSVQPVGELSQLLSQATQNVLPYP